MIVNQQPSLTPRISMDDYLHKRYFKKNDMTTKAFFDKQKNRLSQAEDKIAKY
jgi:hypothetical protein